MNKNMLAVALAALLVGGVAVAAYNSFSAAPAGDAALADGADNALAMPLTGEDLGAGSAIAPSGQVEYADVVNVDPVKESQERFATVIATDPISETSTTSTPRQVCEDVVVQERLAERDGNVGGTVAGAVIGGLVGNQVGGGSGKKVATAAGAVAGGVIGNRVDRNHVGGRVVERVDTQCRTVTDTSQTSKVTGYKVTYRNADGTTGSMQTSKKPGERVSLGSAEQVVGYDVTYVYRGEEQTVRMNDRPGDRLPVLDGEVVVQTAAAGGTSKG